MNFLSVPVLCFPCFPCFHCFPFMFPVDGSKYPSTSFHVPFTSFHINFIYASSHLHVIWTSATFMSFSCVISAFVLFPFHVPFVSHHFADMLCPFSLQVPLLSWFSVHLFVFSIFFHCSLMFLSFFLRPYHFIYCPSLCPFFLRPFLFHVPVIFFQVRIMFLSFPLIVLSSLHSFIEFPFHVPLMIMSLPFIILLHVRLVFLFTLQCLTFLRSCPMDDHCHFGLGYDFVEST